MWRGMNVSFRDMLFLLVFGYLIISAVALAHVAKKDQEDTTSANTPGHVIVEMIWPRDIDADVDLWVQAPGDVPVGYSNKSGGVFSLLRDDLGRSGEANSMNYEVSYARGQHAGEYTVNAMLYRSRDRKLPLPVTVKVSLKDTRGDVKQVLQSNIELNFEGHESTVFRFKIDEKGAFVANSMNRVHKPLRAAAKKTG
jgi:hypothetical protein